MAANLDGAIKVPVPRGRKGGRNLIGNEPMVQTTVMLTTRHRQFIQKQSGHTLSEKARAAIDIAMAAYVPPTIP